MGRSGVAVAPADPRRGAESGTNGEGRAPRLSRRRVRSDVGGAGEGAAKEPEEPPRVALFKTRTPRKREWCCRNAKAEVLGRRTQPQPARAPALVFRPERGKGKLRIRLPDTYGSPEFEAAWRAAVAGQPLPASPSLPRQGRKASLGKLGWLIALYLQNRAFTEELKPATQRPRRAMLEKLGAEKGHVDIEDVDKGVIQASVNARAATPLMAGAWLYAVKAMFDWATREYMTDPATGELKPILADNPCLGVRLPRAPKPADPDEETGHPEFSDDDLDAFEAAYPARDASAPGL